MKKRFKLAAIFVAAMFAAAPVVGMAETSTTVSADADIMQQYTFNDSRFILLRVTNLPPVKKLLTRQNN